MSAFKHRGICPSRYEFSVGFPYFFLICGQKCGGLFLV